jgi:hypothetical protein
MNQVQPLGGSAGFADQAASAAFVLPWTDELIIVFLFRDGM